MKMAALSHARSLRAIGHALDSLGISAFEIQKTEHNKYLVHDWEPSFLRRAPAEAANRAGSNPFRPLPGGRGPSLVYAPAVAHKLDSRGRLKRGSHKIANQAKLSSAFRAIGDFLDRKGALKFHISWSEERVTVRYETPLRHFAVESFTMQNLHDLGVGMYLRRFERRAAR